MIQFQNVHKQFDKLKVLKDVNLKLESGNIIALIGANASGKTTLIKTLLGMVIPTSGEIYFKDNLINQAWEYRKTSAICPKLENIQKI